MRRVRFLVLITALSYLPAQAQLLNAPGIGTILTVTPRIASPLIDHSAPISFSNPRLTGVLHWTTLPAPDGEVVLQVWFEPKTLPQGFTITALTLNEPINVGTVDRPIERRTALITIERRTLLRTTKQTVIIDFNATGEIVQVQ